MTRSIAALLALAVITASCDAPREIAGNASITVKLPPPRPALSSPGFSFRSAKSAPRPA